MQKFNVYLPLILMLAFAFGCQHVSGHESKFVPLFNGKDLEGWIGATDQYRVEDGVIVLTPQNFDRVTYPWYQTG